jgi:uncharacterized membrane protein (UPF0136 family)
MLFAGLIGALATVSTGTIVSAVTSGVFLGSSLYLTSRAKKNPIKMPKK